MFHVKHLIKSLKNLSIFELCYLLFAFSIPFQLRTILNTDLAYIGSTFSYHKAIFFYLSDLLFLVTLFCFFYFQKGKLPYIVFLPLLWAFLELFHVKQLGLGIYSLVKLAEFWLIIGITAQVKDIVKPSIWMLIIGGFIQSVIAVLQFHVKHGLGLGFLGEYVPHLSELGAATLQIGSEKVLRAYGTMPHPNVLGGFLAIIFALWFYVSRETNWKKSRFIYILCGTVMLSWGLLVDYSITAWVATGLLSVVFIAYQLSKKAYRTAIIWCLVLVVSCGTLTWFYKDIVFPRTAEISSNSKSYAYRSQFNSYGMQIIMDNPLGIGPGQYISYLQDYKPGLESWQYQPPHNIFLLYIAEYGIIGLLIAIFTIYKFGFTWNNSNKLLFIMFFCLIVVLGNLDHYLLTIQQTFLLFAFLIGLVISSKDVSQKN
jgi:hypothetical protein